MVAEQIFKAIMNNFPNLRKKLNYVRCTMNPKQENIPRQSEKTYVTNIRNGKGVININSTDIKKISEYYDQL